MTLEQDALELAIKGYWVFPISVAMDDGKKRLSFPAGGWKNVASEDPAEVQAMPWEHATNIGINCEASGIVVIDLDDYYEPHEDGLGAEHIAGVDLFERYQNEIAQPEDRDDDAPALGSISGLGIHIYYQADPHSPIASSAGRVAPWVDVRAEGGLIIFGGGLDDLPDIEDLPLAPRWLAEASRATEHETAKAPPRPPRYTPGEVGTPYGLRALEAELKRLQDAWDRDDGMFNHEHLNPACFAIGQLVAGGELEEAFAYGQLDAWLTEVGAPANQWKTLDSGFWSGFDRPRSATDLKDNERVDQKHIDALAGELLDERGIQLLPPPQWLIPGWVETNSFVHLIGAAGSAKTFVTLDMAACVGSGRSWPDHRDAAQAPRPVVYVMAEAAHGLGKRVRAWNERYGSVGLVKFLPRPVQILERQFGQLVESDEWKVFGETMKQLRPAMIVFDTQARVAAGVEENSASEMGMLVKVLERLQRETEAAVVLVHHTGKGESLSARGSSVMIGAISTEIRVSKRKGDSIVQVANTKQKNDEEAAPLRMKFAASADSTVLEFERQGKDPFASRARQSVRNVLRDSGEAMSVGDVASAVALDRKQVRDILKWMVSEGHATEEDGMRGGNPCSLYRWADSAAPPA